MILFVSVVMGYFFEFMLLSYRTTFTDEGIEQRGIVRRKQIKWQDVTQIRGLTTHVISLKSPDTSITLSLWNFVDQRVVLAIFEQQIPSAAQREYEEFIQAMRDRSVANTARRHWARRFRRSAVVLMIASALAAVAFSHFQLNSAIPRICIAMLVILGIVLFFMGPQNT